MPQVGHKLLVAFAESGLLVRPHQGPALKEELCQGRAGKEGGIYHHVGTNKHLVNASPQQKGHCSITTKIGTHCLIQIKQ